VGAFDLYTLNVGFATPLTDKLDIFVGNRYEEGTASVTTVLLQAELTEKWSVRVQQEYDWRTDSSLDSEIAFLRDMHAWMGELRFERDEGDDSTMVSINFHPKGLRAPSRPATFTRSVSEARDDEL